MRGVCWTPALWELLAAGSRTGDVWFGFLDANFGAGAIATILDVGLILIGTRLIVPSSSKPRAPSKGKKLAWFDEFI